MIRLARATALILATLMGLAILWELRGPVWMFLLSLLVAAAARGPVDYLIGLGLPKSRGLGGCLRGKRADRGGPRAGGQLSGERRTIRGDRRLQTTLRLRRRTFIGRCQDRAYHRRAIASRG